MIHLPCDDDIALLLPPDGQNWRPRTEALPTAPASNVRLMMCAAVPWLQHYCHPHKQIYPGHWSSLRSRGAALLSSHQLHFRAAIPCRGDRGAHRTLTPPAEGPWVRVWEQPLSSGFLKGGISHPAESRRCHLIADH